jgi:hypothetical protein
LFFLDNSAVVDGLLGVPPASSQHAYIKFGKLAESLLPRKTTVIWVPRHKDVPGNEIADRLAKEGSDTKSLQVQVRRKQNITECRMVRPFLPELTEETLREGKQ